MKQFRWLAALIAMGALFFASSALANPIVLGEVASPSATCPDGVDGWTKRDGSSGSFTGDFGSISWPGTANDLVAYSINAGYVVEVCIKDGTGRITYEITGALSGEISSRNVEISHVSYRVTQEPTETFEDLTVMKDAAGTYVRTVTWELDKFVNEEGEKFEEYTGEAGDEFPTDWLLFVSKNESLSGFVVTGDIIGITVTNPNDFEVPFTIEDKLSAPFDTVSVAIECEGFTGLDDLVAPANGTVSCTYTADLGDDAATLDDIEDFEVTNTVTIKWFDTVDEAEKSDFDDAIASFTQRQLIGVDEGTLTDDRFPEFSEEVTGDASFTLPETFICSMDPEDYDDGTYTEIFKNTAYLNDVIGLNDDASVELTCTLPALEVKKDAKGSYDRTVTWELDKFVNEVDTKLAEYSGGPGDVFPTDWLLFVTKTVVEDNYLVTGEITITNPAAVAQFVTDVTDVLDDGAVATVDCGADFPIEIAAGEALVCDYEASPDGDAATLNTATVSAVGNDDQTAEYAVSFQPNPIGVEEGTLTDDRFTDPLFEETVDDDANFTLSEDFVCPPADSELYEDGFYSFDVVNTAYLNDVIELEDSAEVTVECRLRFKGETAWAGEAPGVERYTWRGNWATYVAYEGESVSFTLYAGQTIDVGTVDFSGPADGFVTITVNLSGDWVVDPNDMTLAVQDYEFAPSGNPAPGLFDYKATCGVTSCTITVPENNFYGVHVNVGYWY